jgi:hypothetical protein
MEKKRDIVFKNRYYKISISLIGILKNSRTYPVTIFLKKNQWLMQFSALLSDVLIFFG